MVQNKVPAKCLNVFAKWKDHSEEQNDTDTAIQTMSNHIVSLLSSHQAVHKHYSSWNGQDWLRKQSHHQVVIYFWTNFQCLAVDSIVSCTVVLWNLQADKSYLTIHSFFATKIADTIILYARKMLKTFNHHLNHKCEFTMITGKTLCDHF